MTRAVFIVIFSAIALNISANDAHASTRNCAAYDPVSNVAIWANNSRVQTALFVDQGDDAYWVQNQERVAWRKIPMRVRNIVTNWHVVSSAIRVRNCTRRFVFAFRASIRACVRAVNLGDAYTRELFDQCVADYVEANAR